jgi:hypothetical protein
MNRKIKVAQLAVGLDLIGSKMSVAASANLELTELPYGVQAYSKGSNRTIIIPWTNIKGLELIAEPKVKKVTA